MRAGAYDYLVKPFALDEVGLLLDARARGAGAAAREPRAAPRASSEPPLLESASPAMQRVLATARQARRARDATVLLTGESGTGKNVLAARDPRAGARARAGPFVTIACTTLAEHLLESELFGHVQGRLHRRLEGQAGRGSRPRPAARVFLDEVGELPLELQAKLLRFLEERRFERVGGDDDASTVDARIIAATNRDLEAEVARRALPRGPLLPPERRRASACRRCASGARTCPRSIDHLLATLAARHRRARARRSTPEARGARSRAYAGRATCASWRTRSSARSCCRAATTHPRRGPARPAARAAAGRRRAGAPATRCSLEDLERRHIEQVLAESATLEEAAARLGINVTTLWRKRKRWGID